MHITPGPGGSRPGLGRVRRPLFLMAGFVIGWVTGVATLMGLAALSVRELGHNPFSTTVPDVRLSVSKAYVNDAVQRRLRANPQVVVQNVKTTGLQMDLLPQAQVVLTPTFDVAGFFTISPSVSNQLQVQNGKLAMHMLGEPRLGDLQVPIGLLPFDLSGEVRQSVDQITNDVLLAELNDSLHAGFGDDRFKVVNVLTDNDYLTITLRRDTP